MVPKLAGMKRLFVLLLVLSVGAMAPQSGTAAESPIEIASINSQTGPLSFLGKSEIQSLQVAEQVVNQAGGINGRPIHFNTLDDTGVPQVGVQLASGLIAKNAPVIIGPASGAVCNAIAPLLSNGPVMICLSPVGHRAENGYSFAPVITIEQNMIAGINYFRSRGLKRVALISSIDASGLDMDTGAVAALALPENAGVQLVAREHFSPADIDVAAQIAHIRAANPQAIIIGSTGPPFGTVLHALKDAGIALPVFSPNSNMTQIAMTQFAAYLPAELYFASVLGQAPGVIGKGPVRDAQTVFYKAMHAAGVMHPDVGHVIIWDSAMMIVDAYRQFGPSMTAAQLHDWLEQLHGWAGINGIYDFRGGGQHGMYAKSNEILYTWDAARKDFAAATGPGGRPLP